MNVLHLYRRKYYDDHNLLVDTDSHKCFTNVCINFVPFWEAKESLFFLNKSTEIN